MLKYKRLSLALVTVMGVRMLAGCQKQRRTQSPKQMPPTEVTVVTLQAQALPMETLLNGRTNAYFEAQVRPQVSGILQKRLFEEGTLVKKGQPLYQIDPAPYEQAVKQAKAALQEAQAVLKRAKADAQRSAELYKVKAVSEQENDAYVSAWKSAEAAVSRAQRQLSTARINLDYTKVRAPIDGRVSRSEVTVGALVQSYTTLMTNVMQLDRMYVDVTQTADDVLRMRRELKSGHLKTDAQGNVQVKLFLSDGSEYKHEGKLVLNDVLVDPTTGSVNVRAVFPNPEGELMPGMYVRAQLIEGIRPDAIAVDAQAVMRDPRGKAFVYVVDAENKVETRPVELNRMQGTQWIVDSGLKAGEKVIFEGHMRARPGAVVVPKELDRAKIPASTVKF